jgi:hypothetical protein
MRRLVKAHNERHGTAEADYLARQLQDPVFILLGGGQGGGCYIRVIPLTTPSERFRYRVPGKFPKNDLLRQLHQGDEMILDPGCITVLRQGREHAYFPMDAFLWWREAVFHADYWRHAIC